MVDNRFSQPEESLTERLEKAEARRRQREIRFLVIGGVVGLGLGAIAAVVLALVMPAVFGLPPVIAGLVLAGVLLGLIVGSIPSLRFRSERE